MSASSNVGDFLQYEAQHKVLICKDCQYAIQKSALESHLLRHKIYRGQRQRLLTAIGELDLLEPDDVQLPSATSLPINNLPVTSGHRCTSPGCGALCASEKRMKRHWSEHHHQSVHGVLDQTFANQVHIQTFFRGTKIKYFEVRLPPEKASGVEVEATQPSENGFVSGSDLVKLNYFHHFMISTSHTLPSGRLEVDWGSRVLEQALRQSSLMCGVLCIAAYHHHETSEPMFKHSHLEKASCLSLNFLKWLEESKERLLIDETSWPDEGVRIGAQLMCLRQLCVWAIPEESVFNQPGTSVEVFNLKSFISSLRGCTAPDLALKALVGADRLPVLPTRGNINPSRQPENPSSNLPPELAERLRTLPFRMAEALPKPDSAADFLVTASSLTCLIQCFALSFNADDARSTFRAMGEWFDMIPKLFAEILGRDTITPAALVVIGHWAILVHRAERHCWFLAGSAVKIMTEVTAKLPQDKAAQNLVSNLLP